jgi:DNA-binding transcriptional MerR regulator
MALTKADMAEQLFEVLGLNKREAKELVEQFFEEIRSSLERGQQVKLSARSANAPAAIPRPAKRSRSPRVAWSPSARDKNSRPWLSRAMLETSNNAELPPIPAKRYFTIGEVGELCDVKPHVLRYWEQEFPQLKPVKRRGNRRYYQRHDVMMIRQIRSLLYEQGYTIGGARQYLEGGEAKDDSNQSQQLIRMVRSELEEILRILRH